MTTASASENGSAWLLKHCLSQGKSLPRLENVNNPYKMAGRRAFRNGKADETAKTAYIRCENGSKTCAKHASPVSEVKPSFIRNLYLIIYSSLYLIIYSSLYLIIYIAAYTLLYSSLYLIKYMS